MASKNENDFLIDGIGAMPGGMNSGVVPQLLDKSQVSFATNCTFRGGYIKNRPGLRKMSLTFPEGTNQTNFEGTIFQGAAYFKSEYGTESIVASIGGRLFEIRPDASGATATVTDVSITGDLESASAAIAWLWQAERWMIINDGQNLPIFYDGSTARRSYGDIPVTFGTTSSDFVVPAIGSSVDINLNAPYTGPYNSTVFIGDAFYQVNASNTGYKVTLKSLSAQPGTVIPSSSQLIFPTNLIGQLNQDVNFNSTPPYPSIQRTLSITPAEQAVTISGSSDSYIAFHLATGPSGPVYLGIALKTAVSVGDTSVNLKPTVTVGSPDYTALKYSPVWNGINAQGSSPLGMTTIGAITTGAIGDELEVSIRVPFTGSIGDKVLIGYEIFEITASNNNPTPTNTINVTNINDTAGGTVASGALITSVPELPVGRMGAYGLGRNWMCLSDGRSFIGGDIVGGSSGSPALNNRDSVLRVTENSYLFGGGTFVIPGNLGDIRSMTFTANLDASLGQGPLQVGTPTSIFSCQAPVDRTTWDSVTNPILTQSLIGKGPLGQYSTILVNSDTIFRARDGIGSLVLARRDFTAWGNVPISREMQKVIDLDDPSLSPNATAISFDNRVLMGCFPFQSPLGVYHQGIIALNNDPISSLRGKAASIYDGLWTGIQAFQFVSGEFSGDPRSFAFVYNSFENKIELWELQQSGESEFDNDSDALTWSFETGSLFTSTKNKGPFDLVRLKDGELYISEIQGPLNIQAWFRADSSECWTQWLNFSVCASTGPKQYRSRLGLGLPDQVKCDPTTNRPFCVGNNFQVRLQFTGACKFMGLLLKAVPEQETKFSTPICRQLCDAIVSDEDCEPCVEQGTCLQFPIVFYNLSANKSYSNSELSYQVSCPTGPDRTVYVAAGRINFTLPFPPDYAGPYPPLIMGCDAGGTIVRNIPDGSTQAEIDAIVADMIYTCGQAIAESEVNCNAPAPVGSFSNEVVYFENDCGDDTLTYEGTLPEWITIDTENSRLVGAVGTFTASSQTSANEAAQAAINSFGEYSLMTGNLFCQSSGCPTPSSYPTIDTSPSYGSPIAYRPTDNTLWVSNDTKNARLNLLVLSAETNSVVHTYDLSASGGCADVIYDSFYDTVVVLTRNGSVVFLDPADYSYVNDIGIQFWSTCAMAYDSSRGQILGVDMLRGPGSQYKIINCAFQSVYTSNTGAYSFGHPTYCPLTDKYYVGNQNATQLLEIDPVLGTVSTSPITFPNVNEWAWRMWYVPELQQMFANTREVLDYKRVRAIDMNTFGFLGVLSGADVPTVQQWPVYSATYNSCNAQLYLTGYSSTTGDDGVFQFELSGYTETNFMSAPTSVGIVFELDKNLVWTSKDDQVFSM